MKKVLPNPPPTQPAYIPTRKLHPRIEHRLAQKERITNSTSLGTAFPKLRSLTVDLEFFDAKGTTRNGGMKYKANLEHAKSVFRFNCVNVECVGGDYDLSDELSQAISAKKKTIIGEMRCPGARHNKDRKDQPPCQSILRYKFSFGY